MLACPSRASPLISCPALRPFPPFLRSHWLALQESIITSRRLVFYCIILKQFQRKSIISIRDRIIGNILTQCLRKSIKSIIFKQFSRNIKICFSDNFREAGSQFSLRAQLPRGCCAKIKGTEMKCAFHPLPSLISTRLTRPSCDDLK